MYKYIIHLEVMTRFIGLGLELLMTYIMIWRNLKVKTMENLHEKIMGLKWKSRAATVG